MRDCCGPSLEGAYLTPLTFRGLDCSHVAPPKCEGGQKCSLATAAGARVHRFNGPLASCHDLGLQGPIYETLCQSLAVSTEVNPDWVGHRPAN